MAAPGSGSSPALPARKRARPTRASIVRVASIPASAARAAASRSPGLASSSRRRGPQRRASCGRPAWPCPGSAPLRSPRGARSGPVCPTVSVSAFRRAEEGARRSSVPLLDGAADAILTPRRCSSAGASASAPSSHTARRAFAIVPAVRPRSPSPCSESSRVSSSHCASRESAAAARACSAGRP